MLQKKKVISINPLYLFIYKTDGFIEEKGRNKYLNITLTDNNDEVLKKYMEVLGRLRVALKK